MAPEILGAINAGGSLIGSLGSQLFNSVNMDKQVQFAKDLMKYQWDRFNSPKAQLASFHDAGLSTNAFLNGKGSAAQPSVNMPSSAPVALDGVVDLGSIASYIQSVANAKKAGMDTNLAEQEIKNKEVERQRSEFELNLRKEFGKDIQTAELANAYMQLVLASDTSDLNEQEKALNIWKLASEKSISEANEYNRDILKQKLDNLPIAINLENRLNEERIKSEKAGQAASYASAKASSASAEQTEIFNMIYSDARFKHSLITEAVEGGRKAVEERKLTKAQAEHMNYMVQQAAYANDMKEFTYWSEQIQGFVHSIGEGVSSFYGAGALRELIKLRQLQGKPSLESGNGYYLDNDGLLFRRPY